MVISNNFIYNLSMQLQDFRITLAISNTAIHNQARNVAVTNEHKIQKLLPYSPMLNPIKLAFSTQTAPVERILNERMAGVLDRPSQHTAKVCLMCVWKNSLPTITSRYNHTYHHLLPAINNEDISI